MGHKQPLTEGSSFELILNFKVAGAIKTIVKVTKEMKEAAGGHHHH
jgi:copper(I)-binding protein